MQPTHLPMTGGCQCGAIRYELWDAPEAVYVCHCTECRRQSASAFGISLIVRAAAFRLAGGEPVVWRRPTDTGNRLDCWFCPTCGSRVWHVSSATPSFRSVKGGTLDQPPDLTQAVHLFTARKLPGVAIPKGALCFPGEPPG